MVWHPGVYKRHLINIPKSQPQNHEKVKSNSSCFLRSWTKSPDEGKQVKVSTYVGTGKGKVQLTFCEGHFHPAFPSRWASERICYTHISNVLSPCCRIFLVYLSSLNMEGRWNIALLLCLGLLSSHGLAASVRPNNKGLLPLGARVSQVNYSFEVMCHVL